MRKDIMACVGIILILPICATVGVRTVRSIEFNKNCGGYLKLSADANSVDLASKRLDTAVDYIEKNNLTKGNTGVFWTIPENDLEMWYTNLKEGQRNLHSFPSDASETDISTALVKLRETIIDHSDNGDTVTTPNNIHLFPHNTTFFFITVISVCLGFVGSFFILILITEID